MSHVISTLISRQAPACPALPARSASETRRIRRGSGSSGGAAEERGTCTQDQGISVELQGKCGKRRIIVLTHAELPDTYCIASPHNASHLERCGQQALLRRRAAVEKQLQS